MESRRRLGPGAYTRPGNAELVDAPAKATHIGPLKPDRPPTPGRPAAATPREENRHLASAETPFG